MPARSPGQAAPPLAGRPAPRRNDPVDHPSRPPVRQRTRPVPHLTQHPGPPRDLDLNRDLDLARDSDLTPATDPPPAQPCALPDPLPWSLPDWARRPIAARMRPVKAPGHVDVLGRRSGQGRDYGHTMTG